MHRLKRPSPAFVIAVAALFFALGGTGYAVSKLPRNSVTSAQVKDHSLLKRDFKSGQLPRGPQGAQGVQGDPGVNGEKGDKGDKGNQGDPWTLNNGQFPSGKTLRGVFALGGTATSADDFDQEAISFGFSMTANPVPHYIQVGDPSPPECPGTAHQPAAQPGHLCLYETSGEYASVCVFNPVNDACGESAVRGFGVLTVAASDGNFWAQGTWAATAP